MCGFLFALFFYCSMGQTLKRFCIEFLHNYIYIFILVQAMAKILYGGSIWTEKISS